MLKGASDKAKCSGTRPNLRGRMKDCPLKDKCVRFLAPSTGTYQEWMMPLPTDDMNQCDWLVDIKEEKNDQ